MVLTTPELIAKLEALVDSSGFDRVIGALQEVCELKADHLRSNWQDEKSARVWERAATRLIRAKGVDG